MTFKNWSLAVIAAAMVAPMSASALGISVVDVVTGNGTVGYVENGDTVTLNIRIENNTNQDVAGLGIAVSGYDAGAVGIASDNNLVFVSGSNSEALSEFNLPTVGPVNGLISTSVTQDGAPFPFFTELRVQAFDAVALMGSNGDGSLDGGVGGLGTGNGDYHMSVTFQAVALGATPLSPAVLNLEIGTGSFGNGAIEAGTGNILAFNNAFQSITVVPEPGTALLMGLGLAGLASRRR